MMTFEQRVNLLKKPQEIEMKQLTMTSGLTLYQMSLTKKILKTFTRQVQRSPSLLQIDIKILREVISFFLNVRAKLFFIIYFILSIDENFFPKFFSFF